MTTKESIHSKIEQLDEERAKLILVYVEDLLSHSRKRESKNTTSIDQPTVENDPLLRLIGMVRSADPTNVAEFKDEYIADSIATHGESTD